MKFVCCVLTWGIAQIILPKSPRIPLKWLKSGFLHVSRPFACEYFNPFADDLPDFLLPKYIYA